MIELLDIDLDFAVTGTAGPLPRPPQQFCPVSATIVERMVAAPSEQRWVTDEHLHALTVWWELGVRGARCWHVDAHHDLYGSTDPSAWRATCPPIGRGPVPSATSATYLLLAWRAGVVSEVVWLIPDWLPRKAAEDDLRREMGQDAHFITIAPASGTPVPAPAVTTIAWSTRWIDSTLRDKAGAVLPAEAIVALTRGRTVVPWPAEARADACGR
jgi:hypothetical protein